MIEMTICNAKGICFHDLYFFNVNLLILGFLQIKWRILDLTTVLGSIRSFVSQLNYEKLPDVLQIFTLYPKLMALVISCYAAKLNILQPKVLVVMPLKKKVNA